MRRQVSLLQKCAPPSPTSGLQGSECPGPDCAPCPSSQLLLSASTLQAHRIGPFPVRGEAPCRASQGARSAGILGWAHITVRAPLPPAPSFQDPCPSRSRTPARSGLRRAPPSPQQPLLGPRDPLQARRCSAPLLRPRCRSPRSLASDFFRGSFSRPRRREKVFLSSGSAMLGPRPGRVRALGPAAPPPARPPAPPGQSRPARLPPSASRKRIPGMLGPNFFFPLPAA